MERVKRIAQTLYDKKGRNIEILNISELTSLGDWFIICSCTSGVHVKACVVAVEEAMKEVGIQPLHTEGYQGGTWVLADYGDIILHVMQEETREFYSLERLWSDAERLEIDFE